MNHKYHDKEVEASLNNILYTFSEENDTDFVCLLTLIRDLDVQAAKGDMAAKSLLKILTDFSRLIDVSQQYELCRKDGEK